VVGFNEDLEKDWMPSKNAAWPRTGDSASFSPDEDETIRGAGGGTGGALITITSSGCCSMDFESLGSSIVAFVYFLGSCRAARPCFVAACLSCKFVGLTFRKANKKEFSLLVKNKFFEEVVVDLALLGWPTPNWA